MFVKVDGCDGCTGDGQYDTFTSDNLPTIPSTSTNQRFGFGTTLLGQKVNTSVCLSEDARWCVTSTDFVRVNYQSNNSRDAYFQTPVITYGGVLGLAPNAEFTADVNTEFNLNGADPTFAIYLSDNEDSFLEYGPADSGQYTDQIAWIDNLSSGDSLWGNKIRGIRIGGGDYFSHIDFALDEAVATT